MTRRLKQMNNQNGLTLVELLGSIVILSIIVVSFLGFFIQSARTTKVSGEIIDASYIAQQQAEEIYNYSTDQNIDQLISQLQSEGYSYHKSGDTEEFSIVIERYRVDLDLSPAKDSDGNLIKDLHTLLIKVFDSNNKQGAQIETKFFFDGGGEDDEG